MLIPCSVAYHQFFVDLSFCEVIAYLLPPLILMLAWAFSESMICNCPHERLICLKGPEINSILDFLVCLKTYSTLLKLHVAYAVLKPIT